VERIRILLVTTTLARSATDQPLSHTVIESAGTYLTIVTVGPAFRFHIQQLKTKLKQTNETESAVFAFLKTFASCSFFCDF
jgi:hypothetical protein